MAENSMEMVRKLTSRTIAPRTEIVEMVMASRDKIVPLYQVVGIAGGTKAGEGDNGPWTALRGQFRAKRLKDGKEFASAICFLPDVAQDAVVGELAAGASRVEFAFEIGAQFDDTSATMYVYTARPLIAPAKDDPLAKLMAMVEGPPALPGPDKPAKKSAD